MTWFLTALVVSLFFVVPTTGLMLLGNKLHKERTLIGGIVAAIILTGFNWWIFYVTYPIIGFSAVAWYQSFILWFCELLFAVILVGLFSTDWDREGPSAGGIVCIVIVIMMAGYGAFIGPSWVAGDGRAKSLAHRLHVVLEKPGAYPNTDPEHILQVPEQTADFEANNVLASANDANLGTIYQIGRGTLQSVNHHLYWIYPLVPNGMLNSHKVHGRSPGFVVVDAEEPNVPAQLRLGYRMRFYPGGTYDHSLDRHLWKNGYRDKKITDVTLEVNDNWKPYFTASIDTLTLNFNATVPEKMLLIDPETGSTKEYPLDKIPSWVDRVYSQGTVKTMLNWWGHWGQAPYKFWGIGESGANRYKVSGKPVLVYTTSGHPVWQAIITSWNKDDAASYLALFDARDNGVRLYRIKNLTLMQRAEHVILNSNANLKKLQPVHMSLHEIYGQLTWVVPLLAPVSTDSADENANGTAFQGIAFLRADDLTGDSVALDTNKAAALTKYRQKLAQGTDNSAPEKNSQVRQIAGTVDQLAKTVEGGQTVFYFTFRGDTRHVYRSVVNANNLELPFIHVGTRIRVSFLDTGSVRRDVGTYDDLELQLR